VLTCLYRRCSAPRGGRLSADSVHLAVFWIWIFRNEMAFGRIAPQMPPVGSAAVLFRGETWRWGCSPTGQRIQLACGRSYVELLLKPLNLSHHVDVYLPFDRGCYDAAAESAYASEFGSFLRVAQRVQATNQAESIQRSLSLYKSHAHHSHEVLVVVRHDMQLELPLSVWRCPPHKLGFAAYVDPAKDCADPKEHLEEHLAPLCDEGVSDVMHWVPRRFVHAFFAMVGSSNGTSLREEPALTWPSCSEVCGCFTACPINDISGHSCYSVAATLLPPHELGFCWPPSGAAFGNATQPTHHGRPLYSRPPLPPHIAR
jgi:hypothetical protein